MCEIKPFIWIKKRSEGMFRGALWVKMLKIIC